MAKTIYFSEIVRDTALKDRLPYITDDDSAPFQVKLTDGSILGGVVSYEIEPASANDVEVITLKLHRG